MDDLQESPYCAGLEAVMRERYKKKIRTYVGCDPYVLTKLTCY